MASPLTTTTVSVDDPVSEGSLDIASMVPLIFEKLLEILLAIALLAGTYVLIKLIHRKIQKLETTHENQRTSLDLVEKIITGVTITLAITTALKIVGIDITLLVGIGVIGLSYALQDIIKNYIAGIVILFKAPFSLGDTVKIKEFTGKVTKMDFQSTLLETFDNRHVTIYNSDVIEQSIINYTKNTTRRLELDVIVGYGTDGMKALAIFNKILDSNPKVLKDPKFSVIFKKFTNEGAIFTLKFWVQRPCAILAIRTEIAVQIQNAFDEKVIYMPYYKGIEAGDETGLGKIAPDHEARAKAFYSLPSMEAKPEGAVGEVAPPLALDYEEPEA